MAGGKRSAGGKSPQGGGGGWLASLLPHERYISRQGLANLAQYHYSGVDLSFFGNNILKHYWNWFLTLAPIWIAPNLLTFLGLICTIIGYFVVAFYSPTLTEVVPSWAHYTAALMFWLNQSLDNIDGKQARRTRTSSPLGELFDHVCDACTVMVYSLTVSSAVGLGCWQALLFWALGSVSFYLAHWEEYHVGQLVLGRWDNPTEVQLAFMLLHVLAGALGTGFFTQYVSLGEGFEVRVVMIVLVLSLLGSSRTISCNIGNGFRGNHKNVPSLRKVLELLSLCSLVLSGTVWVFSVPPELYESHPHAFILSLGFAFCYITTRLITQRICREPIKLFYTVVVVIWVVAANSFLGRLVQGSAFVDERAVLYATLGYTILNFLALAVSIITQLCAHLGISCFTIPSVAYERAKRD